MALGGTVGLDLALIARDHVGLGIDRSEAQGRLAAVADLVGEELWNDRDRAGGQRRALLADGHLGGAFQHYDHLLGAVGVARQLVAGVDFEDRAARAACALLRGMAGARSPASSFVAGLPGLRQLELIRIYEDHDCGLPTSGAADPCQRAFAANRKSGQLDGGPSGRRTRRGSPWGSCARRSPTNEAPR